METLTGERVVLSLAGAAIALATCAAARLPRRSRNALAGDLVVAAALRWTVIGTARRRSTAAVVRRLVRSSATDQASDDCGCLPFFGTFEACCFSGSSWASPCGLFVAGFPAFSSIPTCGSRIRTGRMNRRTR